MRLAGAVLIVAIASSRLAAAANSPGLSPDQPSQPPADVVLAEGLNPHPVHLVRPPVEPLSAMAELGRRVFFDRSLSSSGRMSCASCHSPAYHYGPPNDFPAMLGGPTLSSQGVRAVPSLMYLERQPNFSVGPDNEENETITLAQMAALGQDAARTQKTALDTSQTAANPVPQGGLFWDGRVDTLQDQAMFPLLSPFEMDGGSVERVASKLRQAPYASLFAQLFGPSIFDSPRMAVAEAMFAVARYQIESPSFHPYTSKYDFWLEGKARLTPTELRGYELFNDPKKADCGGCHLDQPTADGLPPLFTDHQFEALGVPRNTALTVNRDPGYFDLGICGPFRTDMQTQTQYLWPVRHAHAAQCGDAQRVLPQRSVPLAAAGDGLLQFPRYRSGEDLSARRGREGCEGQRYSSAVSRQPGHHRSAVRPQTGRDAGHERTGRAGHHRLLENPHRRLRPRWKILTHPAMAAPHPPSSPGLTRPFTRLA